jgi:hypothetical protein
MTDSSFIFCPALNTTKQGSDDMSAPSISPIPVLSPSMAAISFPNPTKLPTETENPPTEVEHPPLEDPIDEPKLGPSSPLIRTRTSDNAKSKVKMTDKKTSKDNVSKGEGKEIKKEVTKQKEEKTTVTKEKSVQKGVKETVKEGPSVGKKEPAEAKKEPAEPEKMEPKESEAKNDERGPAEEKGKYYDLINSKKHSSGTRRRNLSRGA